MSFTREDFESLHASASDPWGYESRWYEARKRALSLAMLGRPRYRNAFEPGCSIGVLSGALAARCDSLLCWDISSRAVEAARCRLADHPHVRLECRDIAVAWPDSTFDLIVFSEVGYYLDRDSLDCVLANLQRTLSEDGELLACHWRHPIDKGSLQADDVHRQVQERLPLTHLMHYLDADMRLDLWARNGRSVARRDGLL
ncbi:nodulation protein S (NodS) [Modicisalibacter xianhensis]|uniref:Nodulation protein S (NodS) n=1 Tax=Modicisalibacter xianhensis TaxID=442341 RepID=A0A4R8G6V9_9GAMM|nr:SAM-dependent methyltransferase [Halomonas xianhensis]TDX32346.1 nodulation protein S (NodS) [Halomonas xianhensis]